MGVSLDGHLGQLGWRGIESFSERESSQERGRERKWGAVQSGISPSGSALYSSPPPFLPHSIQTLKKIMKYAGAR
jgi:hypothetical protein